MEAKADEGQQGDGDAAEQTLPHRAQIQSVQSGFIRVFE
jgi:hypothetical protein